MIFEARVSNSTWLRFTQPVDVYDTDGAITISRAIIDMEIERWSSTSEAIVNMDVLTVQSDTPILRGWYIVRNGIGWQVRDRLSDDGHLVEYELRRVRMDFGNTLDATLDMSL